MDEEELEQPSSKINLGSFFERVDSVEKVANNALSRANANLGIINNQKLIINSLSVTIEAMETKIRDIANYIIIEKKLEKDVFLLVDLKSTGKVITSKLSFSNKYFDLCI